MHYTCIACITIDSVMRIDKKIICKFIQKSVNIGPKNRNVFQKFIKTELKSDSESSDSDSDAEKIEAKVDHELITKLEKSGSDSE